MIEIGIRELKSRLSYYVQLMQAGEVIGIKMRNQVVGFLSQLSPAAWGKSKGRASQREWMKVLEKWKQNEFLLSSKPYRYPPVQPISFEGPEPASETIRKMLEEDL